MQLDVSPQVEARLIAAAHQRGINVAALVEKLAVDYLPPTKSPIPVVDEENAAAIAMLEGFLAESPTDPEEQRQAEAEFEEFKKNLDVNRITAGERPLFP
jgi:hypothetical protein